jgi:putative peptidoglycan binding protein
MSGGRSRAEQEGTHESEARTVDGTTAEEQVLSLQSAIGNAAFSRLVTQGLAPTLSRKGIKGGPKGRKFGGPPIATDMPDVPPEVHHHAWKGGGSKGKKGGKRGGKWPAPSGSGMLATGATGPRVTALQFDLSTHAGHPIAVDGIFGPETDGAVRAFQGEEGLVVDGIVGPLTSAALNRRKGRRVPGRLKWSDVTLKG